MDTGDLFADLDGFLTLPRVAGLWLSPDGRRLVVGVSALDAKKTTFVPALWAIDPDGQRPARRLTRSDQGETGAGFAPDGDLLFLSARPGPDKADDKRKALWRLPEHGEAELVADPAGGVTGVAVARDAGTVVLGAAMLPSATDAVRDKELHELRKDVKAILHDGYPVRFWDHDLGPARTRLLVGDELRDLTGHVGRALHDDATWDITPDGSTVVATWAVGESGGSQRNTAVTIDVATGERRVLADDPKHDYSAPRVSPDGTHVVLTVWEHPTPERIGDSWLVVLPVAGGPRRVLLTDWDRWPRFAEWTPDGAALVFVADDHGHAPLWRVDIASGEVTRLTEDGAYANPKVAPDGSVYALRSTVDHPPAPCRVTEDGVTALPGPVPEARVPGRVEEVTATAADGAPLRAWLALPDTDGPAPLLVWIHGGPLSSWNGWHWRWNPWVAVAHGYAVLLPDPAISTGYGRDFIQRGWGVWGDTPYADLMTITDATVARPDIDAARTAAMGGSYGGYMANWVAGHTDRFRAIVTHASLWHMEQMGATTDWAFEWLREMTSETAAAQSPHRFVDKITTPMLVIHGDKDYRVPIGQGMTLWWDLSRHDEDGRHKFLYFPDEGHWIVKPGHVKIWYGTVLAFLDHHLKGADWRPPEALG